MSIGRLYLVAYVVVLVGNDGGGGACPTWGQNEVHGQARQQPKRHMAPAGILERWWLGKEFLCGSGSVGEVGQTGPTPERWGDGTEHYACRMGWITRLVVGVVSAVLFRSNLASVSWQ